VTCRHQWDHFSLQITAPASNVRPGGRARGLDLKAIIFGIGLEAQVFGLPTRALGSGVNTTCLRRTPVAMAIKIGYLNTELAITV